MLDAQAGTAGSFEALFERYRALIQQQPRRHAGGRSSGTDPAAVGPDPGAAGLVYPPPLRQIVSVLSALINGARGPTPARCHGAPPPWLPALAFARAGRSNDFPLSRQRYFVSARTTEYRPPSPDYRSDYRDPP
jgi:hypothetical protein